MFLEKYDVGAVYSPLYHNMEHIMSEYPVIGDANFDCLGMVLSAISLPCKGTVTNKLV